MVVVRVFCVVPAGIFFGFKVFDIKNFRLKPKFNLKKYFFVNLIIRVFSV